MRQGEDRRVMKTLDLDRKIKKLSDSYFTLWQTKKVSLPCVFKSWLPLSFPICDGE